MAWTKMIIVLDGDTDIHDEPGMFRTAMERCDFRWDVEYTEGPLDILDQAAPELGAGTKIGFDATRRMSGDRPRADTLATPAIDDDAAHQAARDRLAGPDLPTVATPEWGARRVTVVAQPSETPPETVADVVHQVWERVGPDSSAADLVFVVDDTIDLADFDEVLFEFTACADPGRDRLVDETTGGRRIGFDATSKAAGAHPSGAAVRRYAPKQSMPGSVYEGLRARNEPVGLPADERTSE